MTQEAPRRRAPRRNPALFRSASFRLATLYAIVYGCSALALVAFLWWETAGLLNRQVDAAITADAQGLYESFQQGGTLGLITTVRQRLAENLDDDALYLVTDPFGRSVVGNLESWPATVTNTGQFFELPIDRAGVRSLARVHSFALQSNFRLLVGRDVQTRARLRSVLTDALLWAILMVAVLGVLGGVLMRSLFRRMVANVSVTADAIAAGDLTRRVRLTGRDDEFDRVAEAINEMLDRIARLMDGVRQVSNAIAHDLRTPITRARSRLEDAGLHAETEAELRAALDRALLDLDAVVGVFEALLRIAEIEAGSRRSAFAPMDLAPLLADVGELYGAVAEEKQLRLEVAAPERLPITGDRGLVQQAVANLLDNAVKFSAPGGVVRLTASVVEQAVEVSVADAGPGIVEAERERATERFFRGEAARSTPGSGLGLALVQAVAQLHGGALRLEDNAPGLHAVLTLARGQEPALPAPES